MVPSWLSIGGVGVGISFLFYRLFPSNFAWFMRLRRPEWLTFESVIPFIWIFIFLAGIGSATLVWEASRDWVYMGGYLMLELAILAYMPVLCGLRSLRAGAIMGATGWLLGSILAVFVWPVSQEAVLLLLPYLLWSPIGTYVTWAMIELNPGEA
jgi:tryptophan-rich sensory protein